MENKWVGFSRSLWSMLLPLLVLLLNQFGVTDAEAIGTLASTVVAGLGAVVAAVLQFMHQRNPERTSAADK